MCGFIGFHGKVNYGKLAQSLSHATEKLSHRGPDESGTYFDDKAGVGLGHRRLSILDLSHAGHQPMESDNGRFVIAYNGEIYNFIDVRKDLNACGYRFRSDSDTEVVLKAFQEWGPLSLQKYTGMFAISIWDKVKQRLFLARDRIGIKPLFYHHRKGVFLFGSELKALVAFDSFPRNIDVDSIPLFLQYQYVPALRTIFKNTFKLLPGHYLIYDGERVEIHQYWTFPSSQKDGKLIPVAENQYEDHLDHLLTQAVSDRLVSDVPLGALLSGGIDSSLVVALMQKVSSSPVKTFSIGFNEKKYDEAPWAAKIADYLGTSHTELYLDPKEALSIIDLLPEYYDEPFADSSAIPTCLVSKLVRSHVTVALSGDGGDEQFAGYVRYWMTEMMMRKFRGIPKELLAMMSRLLDWFPSPWVENCYLPFKSKLPQRLRVENFQDKWKKLVNQMAESELSELYRMTVCVWPKDDLFGLIGKQPAQSMFEETFAANPNLTVLSRLMRVDQKTYLPDAMLTKVDRASMAASLEIRVPLLDHRVVEYTVNLPDDMKYKNGSGKYLLKKLLGRYIPKELFERPKMGFGVPIGDWFRAELKELLCDYIDPARIKKEGLFDYAVIDKKVKEHMSGKSNHQHKLWALLMWEMWRERWL